jgi:hypothetical protein
MTHTGARGGITPHADLEVSLQECQALAPCAAAALACAVS